MASIEDEADSVFGPRSEHIVWPVKYHRFGVYSFPLVVSIFEGFFVAAKSLSAVVSIV